MTTKTERLRAIMDFLESGRASRQLRGLLMAAQEHHSVNRILLHGYSLHAVIVDEAEDTNRLLELQPTFFRCMGYPVEIFPFTVERDEASVVIEDTQGHFHKVGMLKAEAPTS